MKVLGFGDNIIDRFVDRHISFPGGNCVNFAVFAKHLGADSAYLGVFGTDDYGDLLQRAIAAEGVSLDNCVTREGPSGVTNLTVEDGERVFGEWNGGGVTVAQPLVLNDSLMNYISEFALVHSSVFSNLESQLPRLRELNSLVSFDLSAEKEHHNSDYLDRVCPNSDLVLLSASHLSRSEITALLREIVDRGASMALATRGTSGAIFWNGTELIHGSAVLVPREDIVDTMGCGDAFVTAFALALLRFGWSRIQTPTTQEITASLAEAATFAAQQCLIEGAFGHGIDYEPAADTVMSAGGNTVTAAAPATGTVRSDILAEPVYPSTHNR